MRSITAGICIAGKELRDDLRACLRDLPVRIVIEDPTNTQSLQLKRLGPDVMFVEPTPPGESIEQFVTRVKSLSPQTMVAAVDRSPDPELILAAMRAGVDEFILAPFESKVASAVERIAVYMTKRDAAGRDSGKVVGFLAPKGGCGSTTIACHVAAELQRTVPQDILLADFDMETGLVGFFMKSKTRYSIMDAVKNTHRLDYSFWKALVSTELPRLDVIPAPSSLSTQEPVVPDQFRDVFRLIRSIYGWVIADLGRGLNVISLTLLDDLDELFLVSTGNLPALFLARQLVERLTDVGFPQNRIHLILNRVAQDSDLTASEIEKTLGVELYCSIPDRAGLDDIHTNGGLGTGNSVLTKHISGITQRLAGLPEQKSKGWQSIFGFKKSAQIA